MRHIFSLVLGLAWLASGIVSAQAEGSFRFTGSLGQERRLHTATLLPNGRVLVSGGIFQAPGTSISSSELYDPQTGTWSATGSLQTARWFHTATRLVNGKVLVTGGVDEGAAKASAELYDPASGEWAETGAMHDARYAHTETLLQDGRVLVTGGVKNEAPIATVEIYDPAAGTWSSKPDMSTPRHYHSASLLADGRVLVTGGYAGQHLSAAEIYDPVANTWTSMSSMAAPRYAFGQIVLADGRVLVAGGFGVQGTGTGILSGAEIYNPVTNTWQPAGSLGVACVGPTLTLLPDGDVLAAAGVSSDRAVRGADLFDSTTNQWRAISPLRKGRNQHTATLLPDGRVLIVGGTDADYTVLASAELYDPEAPPLPAELLVTRIASGDVVVDGGTAHFRELSPGEQEVVSFSVTNTGPNAVTGLRWTLERAAANAFALASPPVESLQPGQSATFQVVFMPARAANYSASLRIDQGNANATFFTMDLVGPCADRPVNLSLEDISTGGISSTVDFGTAEMGTTMRKTFRLRNVGNRTFVGSVQVPLPLYLSVFFPSLPNILPPESPRPGFSVVAPSRVILSPGEDMTFDVIFNPASTDTVTQTIQVFENATGLVKRTFQAVGKGTRPGSAMKDMVIYRLGDLQDRSVISGAPVNSEAGLLLGSADVWDGWAGRRGHVGFITYGFEPRLSPSTAHMTRPLLLPRTNAGAGLPAGSQAALHFEQGAAMEQQEFGLRQGQNVGVQLWVRASSTTGTHPILQVGDPAGDGMGIWQVDGVFRGRLAQGAWVGEAPVQPGTWQHLALVCHGITSTLYLNGQAVGPTVFAQVRSSGTTTNASLVAAEWLRIGSFSGGTNSWFTGDLDELQFFTLVPGAAFSPQSELAFGAQPDLRVVSSTSPTLTRAPVMMLNRPMALLTEIINVGSGMGTITPQGFEGDAAGDYRLEWSDTGTWQYNPSGTQTTRTLAPGERWVVSVIFTPTAIGPRPATLRLQTTDPDLPEIVLSFNGQGITAEPKLLVSQLNSDSKDEVTYGNVLLGTTSRTNVYLTNVGGLDITSLTARVTGPQADSFVISEVQPYFLNQSALPLRPGWSDYVLISYTPDAEDIDTAWLEITSNDSSTPLKRLLLSGRGVPPVPDIKVSVNDIETEPLTNFSFGGEFVGQTAAGKNLSIYNVGTGPLNFTSVRFEGTDAGDFFLRYPAVSAGSTLDPGQGRAAGIIEFTPSAEGPRSARLVIESDDPDESPFALQLTGTGLPPQPEIAVLDDTRELVSGRTLLHVGEMAPGGAFITRSLKVSNLGGAPLTGLAVTLEGSPAGAFQRTTLMPDTLQPNQELTLGVLFAATNLGPHGATLVIRSNDADEPLYEIQLGGTGSYGETSLLYPDLPGWTTTAIAEAPDGTVLLAGFTTSSSGSKAHFVRRIARDGTEAATHAQAALPNGEIKALSLQSDGRLLVTGDFTSVGLSPRRGIARLNADGTLDLAFVPPTGDFAGRDVLALPTGKIMVAGSGSLGGRANLVRLNANGTLDASFQIVAPNGPVNALALEADGSVLFGGAFTNGAQAPGNGLLFGEGDLRRLSSNGQVDPLFGYSRLVYDIVVRGDDIYVAHRETLPMIIFASRNTTSTSIGMFPSLPTAAATAYGDCVTRLSHSGSVMAMQELNMSDSVSDCLPRTLAFQPGGGLLVAPGPRFWGSPDIQQVSRYHSDTLAVDPGFYTVAGSPASIRALHVQADGKVLVGGKFEGINQWSGAWTLGPPPTPTTGDPGYGDGGPVSGFAQVPHQGNFRPDLRLKEAVSGKPLSDGLSTLEMRAEEGAESTIVLKVASLINMQPSPPSTSLANLTIAFDGAHAGDFTAEVTSIVPSQQIYSNDALMTLRFRPTAAGARQARMRLSIESLARHGYAQNVFELNLRGTTGPVEPPNHFSVMQGAVLSQSLADTSLYDLFEARGMPPGMTMNSKTGQISGRAARPGHYTVTVRMRDRVTRVFTSLTLTFEVKALEVAGQYFGLMERSASVLNGRGGLLSLTLTNSGTWSGFLQANVVAEKNAIHRFTGSLTAFSSTDVSGTASIPRPGSPTPLALAFDIRDGVLTVRLDGQLAGSGGKVAGQGSLVGTCHLGLLPAAGMPERIASGFARASFTARGTMALVGQFAHAIRPQVRSMTQSTAWITGGDLPSRLPFYASLIGGETVSGWLSSEPGSATLLTSTGVACTVPPSASSSAAVAWAGGDAALQVRGGLWKAPLPGTLLLGAGTTGPNARITVGPSSQEFILTATHQAWPLGSNTWPKSDQGGTVQALVTSAAGVFAGQIWTVPYRANAITALPAMPGGGFSGLFIPGLNKGIGLFQSLEKAPAGRYPNATPEVMIETVDWTPPTAQRRNLIPTY